MTQDGYQALIQQILYHNSAQIRISAIRELAELKLPDAAPTFTKAMQDPSPEVRITAAQGLGQLAHTHDIDIQPVARLLADSDDEVRTAAAEILTELGAKSVEVLLHALEHHNSTVRGAAADIMAHLKDERTVEPLLNIFRTDSSNWVRSRARIALQGFNLGLDLTPPTPPGKRDISRFIKAGGQIDPPKDTLNLIRKQTTVEWPSLGGNDALERAGAQGTTAADIRHLLDQLDVRLASGEISEEIYKRLWTRWEERLAELDDD